MSKPGGKGCSGMTSLGGEGADTGVSCLDKVGLGESDPFHLISMRMLPGGRQRLEGGRGAAECRPWGALAGGDRPSKHKWPWEASQAVHRRPGHRQGRVGVGWGGRGGAQARRYFPQASSSS